MEIVQYRLADIDLAMVDFDGELFCSTPQLCEVFRVNRDGLHHVVSRHKEEFTNTRLKAITMTKRHRKEVLEAMLLERESPNTRIWTEDDVLSFTFFLRSDIARQCRAEFKGILKQHAIRNYISPQQAEALVRFHTDPLAAQIRELEDTVCGISTHVGRALNAVKPAIH